MNTHHQINHHKNIKQFAALALLLATVSFLNISTSPVSACSACATNGVIRLPETIEGILKALDEHDAVLKNAIRTKRLNRVSGLVLGMRQLAKGLLDKAPAENRAAVEDSVTQFRKLALSLVKSALGEDYAATATNFKKFEDAVQGLESHFQSHPN